MASDGPVVVITGSWDVADLMRDWLVHHRALGVDAVVVMDYGSTDGTLEVLNAPEWAGFVHVLPFSGLRSDPNDVALAYARTTWRAGWALVIDPDEFLVTPAWQVSEAVAAARGTGGDLVVVPRFHMAGLQSQVAVPGAAPRPSELVLRWGEQDQGKVLVALGSEARTDLAGHGGQGERVTALDGFEVCLLHYPTRSYAAFEAKVDHADTTLRALGDTVDEGFAHHWRRWVRIRDEGGLRDEYLEQFIPDADLASVLASGEYGWDRRLAEHWSHTEH